MPPQNMDKVSGHMVSSFTIRRLDEHCYKMNSPTPMMRSFANCFIFLTRGEVLVESNGKNLLIKANDFMFIPQSVPFAVKYYNSSIGYMGGFSNSYFVNSNELSQMDLMHSTEPIKKCISDKDVPFFDLTMNKLLDEINAGNIESKFTQNLALTMLTFISKPVGVALQPEFDNISNNFLKLIFDNTKPILSIQEYADIFSVTPNHLNKVIKKSTQRPISHWIEDSIIMRSKVLLRDTNMSIYDIAQALNIMDQSYFSRKFKKHEGISPLSYRARNKKS